VLARLKESLHHVQLYVLLQKAVGADRLRYRCIEALDLRPGDVVLDLGCGPAYYFERLPKVTYYGFDTEARYIDYARGRWGDRAEFRCELFTEAHLDDLPPANAIMVLGLLHHLSDEQCHTVLDLAGRALAPGGQVISVDPCFEPSQGRISRWMSENDRGEYVREPDGFVELARQYFDDVKGEIVNDATRIPSSHWMMSSRKPRVPAASA
jgi:SAM-dependent methyltransferase